MNERVFSLVVCFVLSVVTSTIFAAATTDVPTSIWKECKNGKDSLHALVQFHRPYNNQDVTVRYPARQVIHLTITDKAETIWLSKHTDFNGCTFIVSNRSKNHFLFAIGHPDTKTKPINISKGAIDKGIFAQHQEFQKGVKLLLIKDRTPWVGNRKGYNYGAFREDILLVKEGNALNKVTANYNTTSSEPECRYMDTDDKEKVFSNLHFIRNANSSAITNLLVVSLQNNVRIENISISTQTSENIPHEGDQCFRVQNSANVTFRDVVIDGTYSSHNKYGYGVNMENVWNCHFIRLKAMAQWGIFGNNNINTASLEDCDINRFDIHCYGRDISFKNCTFHNTLNDTNTYNQFSSVFGTILFEGCRFERFCPVLQESSYNAYTGYDLVMNNCYMEVDERHNSIIQAGLLEAENNSRPELKEKCWPNVSINGLTLKTNGVSDFYIFNPMAGNTYKGKIGHLSNISINGLQLIPANSTINIIESSHKISTRKRMKRNYTLPNRVKIQKRI